MRSISFLVLLLAFLAIPAQPQVVPCGCEVYSSGWEVDVPREAIDLLGNDGMSASTHCCACAIDGGLRPDFAMLHNATGQAAIHPGKAIPAMLLRQLQHHHDYPGTCATIKLFAGRRQHRAAKTPMAKLTTPDFDLTMH